MPTARQFAMDKGISERTVRSWVEGLSDEERATLGIERAGKAWFGPVKAWESLAAVERRTGPKTKPQEP